MMSQERNISPEMYKQGHDLKRHTWMHFLFDTDDQAFPCSRKLENAHKRMFKSTNFRKHDLLIHFKREVV